MKKNFVSLYAQNPDEARNEFIYKLLSQYVKRQRLIELLIEDGPVIDVGDGELIYFEQSLKDIDQEILDLTRKASTEEWYEEFIFCINDAAVLDALFNSLNKQTQ